jgi:hypothetical protein
MPRIPPAFVCELAVCVGAGYDVLGPDPADLGGRLGRLLLGPDERSAGRRSLARLERLI